MATGLEVLDAVKQLAKDRPAGSEIPLSRFDQMDLFTLTVEDLESRGYDEELAERISASLREGKLEELAKSIGLKFAVTPAARTVIPMIRLRESAGALADEPETLEETFEVLDRIRHPERYAS